MDYTTNLLRKLIAEQVKAVLKEQEDDSESLDLDFSGSDDLGDLDLGADELDIEGGDDLTGGDDLEGLEGDSELGELEDDGDFGGDFGGGGGGFGGFGGGGGGGDFGGDDSDFDEDSEEGDSENSSEEEEGFIPTDPNQGVVEDIKSALEETQDVQPLLNVAKSSIQKYFDSFEQATEVVNLLRQEENLILQDVAKRLNMFLKGF